MPSSGPTATAPQRERRGYALCTAPRSGSNWVCELLASTGALGYPLEYFNTLGRRTFTDPAYPSDPAAQARYILAHSTSPNGVYGVKLFPWQHDAVAAHVRWNDVLPNLRLVHLARRDLLGQALSALRAQQTKQWRWNVTAHGAARYDGAGIDVCLQMIVREYARWELYFARNGVQPLRLVYEDVIASPQSAADGVADLLQLGYRPIIDPGRVTLRPQRDAVTEQWRARFHAEFGDLDRIDALRPDASPEHVAPR
jgi:LPS sulfotransferase NodH